MLHHPQPCPAASAPGGPPEQHDGFATSTRLNMAELRVAIRGVTGLDIDMEEKQL